MKIGVLTLSISVLLATSAHAAGDQPASAQLIRSMPLGKAQQSAPSPQALDGTAFFSNITNFLGQAFANGGAAADPAAAANTITRLLCDDVTYNAATGRTMTGYRFTVANLNAAVVSARPRVRFYQDTANAPGTYIGGNSFNAIPFNPGVAIFQTGTLAVPVAFPGTGAAVKAWACITFDNNSGATGATLADLNNLGVGVFNPPDRGTSADQYFLSTANGSFVSNNPPGAIGTLGGGVVANFGYEILDSVTLPVQLQSFGVE